MIRRSSRNALLLAIAFALMPMGCASQLTVGELRRRSLFRAMLWAWVLGLAVIWRWWGRPRSGKEPNPPE